ncbi:ABC1 kinase family protein [Salimicrobium flavidum]|uniref:Predicted unusual protein kinase regulating ubiquinone biosynthesis, AarF/ABC1/UbiB family n=1 Tax=Salimicrobium flavidum TaxID=570947 RepID=A0A1N7IV35_9BACI|nr:AarF/ABC1/UbiB kinase family protein [Salimicrobium flavidum]SIS40965.1 Predicted unusual protein kinase regulating ubiquinone biosynthesis, AarF/ABC1/UbiB family [Salimicrobium flavidum]
MNSKKYIGIYRMYIIIWMSIKFLWKIFWFQKLNRIWDQDTERKWEELLKKMATEYRQRAVYLGGLLIKFGQFLSSRGDLLPASFIRELEGLVDRVQPVPFSFSKEIIEEDWQESLEKRIASIDEDPVASASIGEVYKAYLHDGTPVAVKVQRYRVREIFQTDFKAMRVVFWMLNRFTIFGKKADLPALYKEVVAVMSNELDFTMELENGNYFRKRFEDHSNVYIPEYFTDLSTGRVLVMEWVEGTRVTDISFIKRHNLDRERLARTIFDLCVEQFVNAGMFHADPHAGNIMIKQDGTVVILDFGMVGKVKREDVEHIRAIIEGFIIDDYDRIIASLRDMDFLLEGADTEAMKKMMRRMLTMYLSEDMSNLDATVMNEILEDMQDFVKDQPIQLPADYAFLGRAASMILGVLMVVHPKMDIVAWGKPVINEWMTGNQSKFGFYKNIAKETGQPLLSLPRALVEYLEDGDKEREWQRTKQQQSLWHHYYFFYAAMTFFIGIMTLFASFLMPASWQAVPVWVFYLVAGFSFAGTLLFSLKHAKMIKNIT